MDFPLVVKSGGSNIQQTMAGLDVYGRDIFNLMNQSCELVMSNKVPGGRI
jgi:hypothetical protein